MKKNELKNLKNLFGNSYKLKTFLLNMVILPFKIKYVLYLILYYFNNLIFLNILLRLNEIKCECKIAVGRANI
jgi:hypothetical protein